MNFPNKCIESITEDYLGSESNFQWILFQNLLSKQHLGHSHFDHNSESADNPVITLLNILVFDAQQ